MTSLTVFTVANRRYEPFVLPYIASVLHHNDTATIEIALEDPGRFRSENAPAIETLGEAYGDRFDLSSGDFSRKVRVGSLRFLMTPRRRSDYAYIGDIDILVLEDIVTPHLGNMARTGLRYSNILRPGLKKLSGLHFTEWDAFYPQAEVENPRSFTDEGLLCAMVERRGLRLPDPDDTFRPTLGYHLTLGRPPYIHTDKSQLGWKIGRRRNYLHAYLAFRRSDVWKKLMPLLDPRYTCLLMILEAGLHGFFQEEMPLEPGYGAHANDWWG